MLYNLQMNCDTYHCLGLGTQMRTCTQAYSHTYQYSRESGEFLAPCYYAMSHTRMYFGSLKHFQNVMLIEIFFFLLYLHEKCNTGLSSTTGFDLMTWTLFTGGSVTWRKYMDLISSKKPFVNLPRKYRRQTNHCMPLRTTKAVTTPAKIVQFIVYLQVFSSTVLWPEQQDWLLWAPNKHFS